MLYIKFKTFTFKYHKKYNINYIAYRYYENHEQ